MTSAIPPVPSAMGVRLLGEAVWRPGIDRVAVVGTSKNAGKTTALNALLAAASVRGWRCGLVSIGLDGEAVDAWLDLPKPPVQVERDTLVATALPLVEASGRVLEVVAPLGFSTTMGPTVVARARGPGTVQLAGIAHRGQLKIALAGLRAAGADKCLIDGAYHRQAAAHPDIADGVVAAVGAVLDADTAIAVAAAEPTLWALSRPTWSDGEVDPQRASRVTGALADGAVAAFGADVQAAIARDPSCVLVGDKGRNLLRRKGIAVYVAVPVPLIAVVANPGRPGGQDADAAEMLDAVTAQLQRLGLALPVVDVVAGGQRFSDAAQEVA